MLGTKRRLLSVRFLAVLFVLGWLVVLFRYDSKNGKVESCSDGSCKVDDTTPSKTSSTKSSECSSLISSVVRYVDEGSGASQRVVCLQGVATSVVSDVLCALPNAVVSVTSNLSACNVRYGDYRYLSPPETERLCEATVLSIPEGVTQIMHIPFFAARSDLSREVAVRDGTSTIFAARGEASSVRLGGQCVIRRIKEPQDASFPIWVMRMPEDDDASNPFAQAAEQYAIQRGYGFAAPTRECVAAATARMPISWQKIAFLWEAAAQGLDGWVLWLDPLALVTNMETKLEVILKGPPGRKANLLVGQDAQPPYLLNVGVLLVRMGKQGADLLETIWRCGVVKQWTGPQSFYWDQNALTYLTEHGMSHAEFWYWHSGIRLLPHRVISSFMRQGGSVDSDLKSGHWRQGDFIALMTGVNRENALAQAKQMQGSTLPLMWLSSPYRYPSKYLTPPMYSVALDTFFFASEPTWLVFATQDPKRYSINPSCVWWGDEKPYDRVWCVVRTINYYLNLETGAYEWPSVGLTINQFFELSAKQYANSPGETFTLPSTMEMEIPTSITSRLYRTNTEGFEDVKLIRVGDKLYGICTSLQMTESKNCVIVLLTLDQHRVVSALPLRGYRDNDCHKNWMPFIYEGSLHVVEQIDPLVVLRPDVSTGKLSVVFEAQGSVFPGLRLRGTSNGLRFSEGHLFIIHETITRGQLYAHRFMYVTGKDGWKRRLSRPFFLVRKTVEFIISMQLTEDQSELILGVGFEDRKPGFVKVSIKSPSNFLAHEYFWMSDE